MKTARRFLLDPSLARLIVRECGFDRKIIEGYLSAQPGRNQFVRAEADQFYLVIPLPGPSGETVEEPALIPQIHGEAMFELSVGQISYTRVYLPAQSPSGQKMLLDRVIYPDKCDIITVEFYDQQEAEAYSPAGWFGPEVTGEYAYDWRHLALNGMPALPAIPISSLQVEAVLDMLDQAKQITDITHQSKAQEVVFALSRSLESSGMLKGSSETSGPAGEEPVPEQLQQPTKRVTQ
jgi:CYTH domain-containing protein